MERRRERREGRGEGVIGGKETGGGGGTQEVGVGVIKVGGGYKSTASRLIQWQFHIRHGSAYIREEGGERKEKGKKGRKGGRRGEERGERYQ